jgi:uncharacterized pyridoxal phosphate-dependent enzyme
MIFDYSIIFKFPMMLTREMVSLRELGVNGVVNATGTLTVLGGSVLSDEVLAAMSEAAKVYVDMEELHLKAGEYVAQMLGVESAYIVDGAAAGLVLCVAACLTQGERAKALALPNTLGMPNKILIQKVHRNMYDYAATIPGALLVEIGSSDGTRREELEGAVDHNTAGILYVAYDPQPNAIPLEAAIEIAHKHGIPVIVDAAAELPPAQNLTKFVKMGADMVVFSGGKDIGAPNDTGLIVGKKRWIDVCRELGPQSYRKVGSETKVFIGRPMKVSKEDILGFVTALRRYLEVDHDKRLERWGEVAAFIAREISTLRGVRTRVVVGHGSGHPRPSTIPKVEVEFEQPIAELVRSRLIERQPPVYTYIVGGKLCVNPQCLREGEQEIVVNRLKEVISEFKV